MVLNTSDRGNKTLGFRGVFDGRGHTITGMKVISANWATDHGTSDAYRFTGFISVLHKDGVIKDVSFTKAGVQYCSYLASWGEGKIENVYVGYTGDTNNAWNSTVNTKRDSAPAVTMRDCVISYDTDWQSGYILGKANATANAYRNVYVVGPENTQIVSYWNDETGSENAYKKPLGRDNFGYYTTFGELLSEHKNEINGWNYFTADSSGLSFGSKGKLVSASEFTRNFTGNTIISADKTSSDYVIVCEDGNESAMNAATFIAKHIERASGNVSYTNISKNSGFYETLSGGVRIAIMTEVPEAWSSDKAYIVIGKSGIPNAPQADAGKYIVKTNECTAFIDAYYDDDYIAAAMAFLEESLGYLALSDDTVYYEKVDGTAVSMPAIDISLDSAFNSRNSTNTHNTWKNNELGLNGRDRFPIGPTDANGKMQPFHNTLYWLDYKNNKSSHPSWFRSDGSDICYAANGTQDETNAEYVAMVTFAANNVRKVLNANPSVKDVTFSLSDGDLNGCTCSVCKENHTNAAIKFLNDVVAKIQNMDGNSDRQFTIYVLAYYYLIDAPTIDMNEHLGVIFAPIRNSYEAESIYSSVNDSVRSRIEAWLKKTTKMGFWFYGTLYHNYMIYTDTVRSLLTWFEYASNTVKAAGGDPVWIYVNGQTRQHTVSVFEAFKQYAFSKAQIEITEKVSPAADATKYYNEIDAYLFELESEFFGFTVNGTTKTFRNGGYYGVAAANEAMYNMYAQMKADYNAINEDNNHTVYEYLDTIKSSGWFSSKANRLCDYLTTEKTDGYWLNYTKAQIQKYMTYVTTAQNAISSYSGEMKSVYEQHILIESLAPRFMICVAGGSSNSTYGFASGYNGTDIATMRTNLKSDFDTLGVSYYGEHYLLADLYANWGIA